MFYLKWTRNDLVTLEMRALYTEVDEDGWVHREVGIDGDGLVRHQLSPSSASPGWFGLTRLSGPMLAGNNISKAEFEAVWDAGGAAGNGSR